MKNFTSQSRTASNENLVRPFIPRWVRTILPNLKGAPLAVLIAYWSHANRDGLAWPSIQLLVIETGFGKNTVKRARKTLIGMGLLLPVEQHRDTNGHYRKKVFSVLAVDQKLGYGAAGQFSTPAAGQKVGITAGQKVGQEGVPYRSSPKRRSSAPAPVKGNSENQKEEPYKPEVSYV